MAAPRFSSKEDLIRIAQEFGPEGCPRLTFGWILTLLPEQNIFFL
jgi:hypothetical protein